MRRYVRCFAVVLVLIYAWAAWAQTSPRQHPKLVLLVVIDQFRYDYLTRFRDQYTGGFGKLLTSGAVFENANLDHYPTVTAIGHATTLSGATPALSGIIGNDWYDRGSQKRVLSISDDTVKLIDGSGSGASPRRLLVSTIGDQLKIAHPGISHVIGISLKDRSAILPAGHMADGAYWYDTKNGNFISSTYYFSDLPEWVKSFNERRPSDKFAGAEWAIAGAPAKSSHLPQAAGAGLYGAIFDTRTKRFVNSDFLLQRSATFGIVLGMAKNPHAAALGRKGGKARLRTMTEAQRRESARHAGIASGRARRAKVRAAKQKNA